MTTQEHSRRSRRYAFVLITLAILVAALVAAFGISASTDPTTTAAVATTTTVAEKKSSSTTSPPETSTTVPDTRSTVAPDSEDVASTTTTAPTALAAAQTTPTTTIPAPTTTVGSTTTVPDVTTTTAPTTTSTTTPPPPADHDVDIVLADHNGLGLEHGVVAVLDGPDWNVIGSTDPSGVYTARLVEGVHTVRMSYGGTVETRQVTVDAFVAAGTGTPATTFTTGRVELNFSGAITNPDGTTYTGPVELLPGSRSFSFFDATHPAVSGELVVQAGQSLTVSALYVGVSTSSGTPISGSSASGWLPDPTGGKSWQPMGSTNSSGALLHLHEGSVTGDTPIRAASGSHGLTTVVQDPSVNSFYDFATSVGTATLHDHTGTPIGGGLLSVYTNGQWHDLGTTDATGAIAFESFAGDYSYAMSYNHTREQRDAVDAHTSPVSFQTGRFTIHFTGDLAWGPGSLHPYSGPQEVLPGDYFINMHRTGWWGITDTITVSAGDDITKTGVFVRVRSSNESPIEGAQASINLPGWPSIGSTDAHGVTAALLDGELTSNRTVRVNYNGTTANATHAPATDSFYDYQTIDARTQVLDSTGSGIPDVSVHQNSPGWPRIGVTDAVGEVHTELFSGFQRSYRISFNGTSQTKKKTFTEKKHTLVFRTIDAVVRVAESNGDPIVGVAVHQNSPGWPTVGSTDSAGEVHFEVLAGYKRQYRVSHNGTTATKTKKFTPKKPELTFTTLDATIRVLDSSGAGIEGLPIHQNAPGWPSVGATDAAGEVHVELFKGYKRQYRVSHNGTTATKTKKFTPKKPELIFTTVDAAIRLIDSQKNPIPGVAVHQNAPGWPSLGTTDTAGEVHVELFTGYERQYRVSFHGTSETKSKKFGKKNPLLVFRTIKALIDVKTADGTAIKGVSVRQNSPGWPTIGTTNANGRVRYEVMRGYERQYRVVWGGETVTLAKAFVGSDRKLLFEFDAPKDDSL